MGSSTTLKATKEAKRHFPFYVVSEFRTLLPSSGM